MRRKGITLVEILVVMAILVVLAGLLVPVLASARGRSKAAVDVSNLRQLGQAATMYMEGDVKRCPTSARVVVDAGLAPKSIVASPRDDSKKGLANVLLAQNNSELPTNVDPTSYKMSYAGAMEQGWSYEYVEKNILPGRGAGWLVNIVECKPLQDKYLAGATGHYQRLMMDGSVQNRVQTEVSILDDGKPMLGINPILMYIDEDGKWIDEHKL